MHELRLPRSGSAFLACRARSWPFVPGVGLSRLELAFRARSWPFVPIGSRPCLELAFRAWSWPFVPGVGRSRLELAFRARSQLFARRAGLLCPGFRPTRSGIGRVVAVCWRPWAWGRAPSFAYGARIRTFTKGIAGITAAK